VQHLPKRWLLTPCCELRLNWTVIIRSGTVTPKAFDFAYIRGSANHVIVRFLGSSFRVAAILLLANAMGANTQTPTAQIDRVSFVPLGSIDQWISIRGENRANPVVLVVHGGPGEAQWPQAKIYRPWEKIFTVVQWDQRGAGHTFGRYGTNTPDSEPLACTSTSAIQESPSGASRMVAGPLT